MASSPDGKDAYCKQCRHAVTAAYENNMSPEQKARRKEQKAAWYLRKIARIKEARLEENVSGNISGSADSR